MPNRSDISSADVLVYKGVVMGSGARLMGPCVVGMPQRGDGDGAARNTRIGKDCTVRPFTTIYAGVSIGDRLQTGQGATIREGNVLGDDVSVGTNAVLECGNEIGSRVRIHTGCFLECVVVEDDVFIAPNVVFADDPHPPCPRYEECVGGATVRRGARIGSNSTILPGVVIGEGALVGAGSVVTRDVAPHTVVVGNPARFVRFVSDLTCDTGLYEHPYAWLPVTEARASAEREISEFDSGRDDQSTRAAHG